MVEEEEDSRIRRYECITWGVAGGGELQASLSR